MCNLLCCTTVLRPRDLNGAHNILAVFLQHVQDGTRPVHLRRPGKGAGAGGTKACATTGTPCPAATAPAPGTYPVSTAPERVGVWGGVHSHRTPAHMRPCTVCVGVP